MENAVIYARYSSHSQTEQSIEGQLNAGHRYAESRGYKVIAEYCDRAKTGTNDNREEFQRMLSDSARKKFSVIIVWKVDRFGRNREEITFNKYKVKKNGVRVEYVAENVVDGPEGVILESVLEGMAEYYSLQLSQNIKRGLLETAKKHKPINGLLPLGYRMDSNKDYEVDPDTAPIIKLIFERYAAGDTMADIMHELNKRNYKTSRGKEFTKNSIPRILHNEIYIGTYRYKDVVYAEDVVPPIIDKELFYKAKKMLNINKHMTNKNWSYSDYILSGKIYCAKCGSLMAGESGTSKSGKKYNYYICSKRHQRKECDSSRVRQDVLEEKIIDYVNTAVLTDDNIDYLADAVYEYQNKENEEAANIKRYEKEIENIDKSIANIIKSIEQGLDYDLVKDRIENLKDEKVEYQRLVESEKTTLSLRLSKEQIRYFLNDFRNKNINDRDVQKRICDTFIHSITVSEDSIDIQLNYHDSENTLKTVTVEDEGVLLCVQKWSYANDKRTRRIFVGSRIEIACSRQELLK